MSRAKSTSTMKKKKRLEVIAGQKWEDMWISKPDASRLMTEV